MGTTKYTDSSMDSYSLGNVNKNKAVRLVVNEYNNGHSQITDNFYHKTK